VAQLKKLADSKKKPVLSAFDIELYGYVELDLAHDSDRTSVGNCARWVESEQLIKDHGEFSLINRNAGVGRGEAYRPEIPRLARNDKERKQKARTHFCVRAFQVLPRQ
jgi:hypothetical protein